MDAKFSKNWVTTFPSQYLPIRKLLRGLKNWNKKSQNVLTKLVNLSKLLPKTILKSSTHTVPNVFQKLQHFFTN